MDVNSTKPNKVFVVLLEDEDHECKPVGMLSSMRWALSLRQTLQTNFPGFRFTVMQWDFVDADALSIMCGNNIKSLLQ